MFINVWLPVWGTANKCRTSSQRSWQFFWCVFVLWFAKRATDEPRAEQKTMVQLWRGLIYYFTKQKKPPPPPPPPKKKNPGALRGLQDKRFGSHLTGVRKCKF